MKMENYPQKENDKKIPRAWLFDCDGPLTDPGLKRITTDGLGRAIGEIINRGEIVAINTGRSNSWLFSHDVMKEIENSVQDKSKLSDVIAVGEKGGSWSVYENGEWITHVDPDINVPQTLSHEIRTLIEEEFSESMFFDETKLTMISTEMHDKYPQEDYKRKQPELIERMHQIISKEEYQHFDLKIDPTTIATDIQKSHVGKHLGAKRILAWLSEKGFSPKHYITVGDSDSDAEMADELASQSKSVEFVFVNDKDVLKRDNPPYPVTFTDKKFGEGTLEFINSKLG